jgi:AbiJ N-terminal domain 4
MDDDLRVGLWNVLDVFFWQERRPWDRDHPGAPADIASSIWLNYFKERLDTIPHDWRRTIDYVRNYFFSCTWNEVYDFIEYMPRVDSKLGAPFIETCNLVLEREMSAYRFVSGRITEITSATEIDEIETALAVEGKSLVGARTHLQAALDLLSDRTAPDYRNSIKESISAVESLANVIVDSTNATLGAALNKVEQRIAIHPALKTAFSKLYGYTSDAHGIRHALMDEPELSFEDAKFMLVSCSAFVNYLVAKAGKAGLAL